jgi:hypothetical protein
MAQKDAKTRGFYLGYNYYSEGYKQRLEVTRRGGEYHVHRLVPVYEGYAGTSRCVALKTIASADSALKIRAKSKFIKHTPEAGDPFAAATSQNLGRSVFGQSNRKFKIIIST